MNSVLTVLSDAAFCLLCMRVMFDLYEQCLELRTKLETL